MIVNTSDIWSYRNGKKNFKEKFEGQIRIKFNIFSTKTTVLGKSHIIQNVVQSET
jgi:hypothetical protein